ncbi:MAG: hypothetical protein JSU90_03830, partial [Nitrospiraceae bacterium]
EMAGYATGEVFFVSQALGLRHSHLDSAGYSYDQKPKGKTVEEAVEFLMQDEKGRVFLTSMVACLFARSVYTDDVLAECLQSVGYDDIAANMDSVSGHIQKLRWKTRIATGFDPAKISIPKRFMEVTTWKGKIDGAFLSQLKMEYGNRIVQLGGEKKDEP